MFFLVKLVILVVLVRWSAADDSSDDKVINVCVMIGDIQAGQVAYERFAAIIDLGIKHANQLYLPANISLQKHHVLERPRISGLTHTRSHFELTHYFSYFWANFFYVS